MALKDYLPKKPTKAEQQAKELSQAEKQRFFDDFEAFQRAHNMRLAAVVIHDLKGSHVEFTLIPYEDVTTPGQ